MPHIRSRFLPRVAALAVVACAALAAIPALALGSQFNVNTTADVAPTPGECGVAPGDCALRQAIDAANKTTGPDTIVLPAGHYALTIKGDEEDEGATGDLDVIKESNITIQGAGARTTSVDATGLEDRVFDVQPLGSLSLSKLTVTGGLAIDQDGGGIRAIESSLNLDQVAVTNNTANESGYGGGLFIKKSLVGITSSLFAGNRNSGDGGAIFSEGSTTKLTIINSTLANNAVDTSLFPSFPPWGAYGGAMEVDHGALTMQNVTIAGNSIHDGNGGGEEGYGAGLAISADTASVLNTIVYGNTGTNVEDTAQCHQPIPSSGHNLEDQPPPGHLRCFEAPTDLINNPLLGPLANNGGETDTMALQEHSPAINTGDSANCPATDQRGVLRPQGGGCDIGAFELAPPLVVVFKPTIKRHGHLKVKKAGSTFLVKTPFQVVCPAGGPTCGGAVRIRVPKPKAKGAGTSAAKQILIGKAPISVAPGKKKQLSLKLTRKGAKMLRQAGKLRGQLEIVCHAGSGPAVKAKATLKLKLPS